MLSRNRISALFFLLFVSSCAFADYAWIPKYETLNLRAGVDYLNSDENFSSDSQRVTLSYLNQAMNFSQYRFWFEPEYGFAKDWSVRMKAGALIESLSPQGGGPNVLTGNGLSDLSFGLKWNVYSQGPMLTVETDLTLPTYSLNNVANDELLLGDGSVDWFTKFHVGYFFQPNFLFDLSPGFILRSNGYSPALTLEGAAEFVYHPIYFRIFSGLLASLNSPQNLTGLDQNPILGSGGSFVVGSKEPTLFTIGVKSGVTFYQKYRFEATFTKALLGTRAPNFWMLGGNFFASFDFYHEEKKIPIHEVPFNSDQDDSQE